MQGDIFRIPTAATITVRHVDDDHSPKVDRNLRSQRSITTRGGEAEVGEVVFI